MKFLLRSPLKPHHYHRQSRRSFGDATIKRVRDRGLEHAVEKERSLKPMLNIKNLIKSEPSKSVPISLISQNKEALGLWTRPIDFIRSLDGEELSIFQTENYRKQAADRLLKLLMLSRINKIPLTIVDRLKWDLGLPQDYVETLVPEFPDYFQVTSAEDHFSGSRGMRVLELVCWSNELAISVMEKKAMAGQGGFEKGMAIAFPLHFSRGFEMDKKMKKWVDEWQKLVYTSPYENASHLPPKSDESDKWAVGLLHELLHLFVPKKTDKENILCLGEYMGLRSRFKRALVNHPGIFYLSTKTGMHTVLLKEAYKRDLLIEKHPLMEMRYQYIHLMNTVKEDNKPINAPGTSPKKEQKNASDASGEKSEQVEDAESGEEYEGELHSDVEEASDEDYDDEDEDDEIETHRDAHQNVAANRRTTRKVNFDARGPLRNPVQERSGGRLPGAREGQGYPGAREGQRYPGAREAQRYPGAREGQRHPGAREGQRHPGAREGQRHPGTREGQRYPGAREGQRYPGTREGQRYPGAREGQRYPGAREGQRYPGTREGLRSGKRAEMYNGNKVHRQSSEKSNFPRSRGRSLTDKRASFQ
ncbi:Protein WHAT'S THIS FACTOR 1-like [Vitis vinifera]|uniref:Protein WHAT'S THIS FACTOR 1-like n=1 Tax=Vitis vinifera TaxID=29760 RepID=A0A438DK03_VITVI|nr:Protein WHAT'S THIS FACTOR 1-like [Vitis vinifera]